MRHQLRDQLGYGTGSSAPANASWLSRLLRPRHAIVGVLAAAAALLFVVWRGGGSQPAPSAGTDTDRPALVAGDSAPAVDLRAARVADLELDELDELLDELSPELMVGDDDLLSDELLGDAVLSADEVALWTGGDDEMPDDTDDELGLFDDPDLDALLEDLSEEELNQLDAFLATQTG